MGNKQFVETLSEIKGAAQIAFFEMFWKLVISGETIVFFGNRQVYKELRKLLIPSEQFVFYVSSYSAAISSWLYNCV